MDLWAAVESNGAWTVTQEGIVIASCQSSDVAHRIVACVNACRGIPTATLEGKALKDTLEAARGHIQQYRWQSDLGAAVVLISRLLGDEQRRGEQ